MGGIRRQRNWLGAHFLGYDRGDDREAADHDHVVGTRQLLDEFSCRGAHFSTVSLTLQAISQNSETDEGL